VGLGHAIAIVLVAAGSAFAERRGVWLSDGVGLRVVLLDTARPGLAAARVWFTRRTAEVLDPLIHVPARLQIMAMLAALPDGDALSFTRLQDMIGLKPGDLITHLRKLQDADYLTSEKTGNGPASRTSVALTHRGRAALDG
jgi:DNA-binding MarR family transcriptional regulator